MKRPPQIQINQFQLGILLDEEQKQAYQFILKEGVLCVHCMGIASEGIVVNDLFLTDLNDIMIRGTCNKCQGKANRIIEFGENKAFYEKAMAFRKSITP